MTPFLTYLPVIKDIVTILATATAAIVAIIGLQTWKRQIRGNAEYDLARRVLIAVYRVRNAIFRYNRHFQVNRAAGKETDSNELSKLDEEFTKLNIDLLEAEAVWGNDIEYRRNFISFNDTLEMLKHHEWNLDSSLYPKRGRERITPPPGQIVNNDYYDNEKDDYFNDLGRDIKRIEDFLRPKLTLKQRKRRPKKWT